MVNGNPKASERQWPRVAVKIVTALVVVFALGEAVLHLPDHIWPSAIRNLILSKYTMGPDGIYFRDSRWGIHIIKPEFIQKKMFYNGYRWNHQSNKIGIRDNRDFEKADVVALGDSVIYGHGVDLENTLCYNLEKITGLIVANLGVQADYPPYEYLRLKNLGLFLKPGLVLFFIDGLQDELDFLFYDPTMAYIDGIISETVPDYSKGLSASTYLNYYDKKKCGEYHLDDRSRLCKAIKQEAVLFAFSRKHRKNLQYDKSMMKEIMRKVIVDAQRLCELNQARLVIIFNLSGHPCYLEDLSKKICDDCHIPFLDLNRESPKSAYRLKNDGHYSAEGNRWAAECIAKYLKGNNLLPNRNEESQLSTEAHIP